MISRNKAVYSSCFYSMFVNGMLTLSIGAMIEPMRNALSIGIQMASMFLVAYAAGNLGASLLSGIMPYRLGQKNTVILLTSAAAAAFLGLIFTDNYWLCILCFFLSGIGRGGVSYIVNLLVNSRSAGNPLPLNILHAFYGVGAILSPFLAATFINNGISYKYVFAIIFALIAAVLIIFINMDIENTKGAKTDKSSNNVTELLKNPVIIVTGALMFLYLGVENGVNGWMVTYLVNKNIMTMTSAQSMLSIMWLFIIFGRLGCAYISKTVHRKNILLGIVSGVVVFFALFLVSEDTVLLMIAISGLGFSMGGIYPTSIANSGEAIADSPVGMALLLTISGVGGMVFPYISGSISEAFGVTGGMIFIGIGIALLLICAIINKCTYNRKV